MAEAALELLITSRSGMFKIPRPFNGVQGMLQAVRMESLFSAFFIFWMGPPTRAVFFPSEN